MSNSGKIETGYSVNPPSPRLVTARGLGISFFVALAIILGLTALIVPPLILSVVVLSLFVGVVIAVYPFFGLVIYYLVVVVHPEVLWPQIAVLRPARIISVLLVVSIIIHKQFLGHKFIVLKERANYYLLAFTAALFASVPLAYWPYNSFWFAVDFLWIVLYYVILTNLLTTEARIKSFVWLIILAAGYSAISSALAYRFGQLVVAQGIERAEGLSGIDPNTLAVSLMLAIPFLFFSLYWISNRLLRLIPIAFLVASVFTIAITGSRSGIIGLVVTAFLIWLVSRHRLLSSGIVVALLILGWFALPAQYKDRYSTIFSQDRDASTEGRLDAWEAGWGMFKANPLTGIGVDCFPLAYGSGEYSDNRALLRPHSMYIQIISELGLLGLLTFGALIWYIMRSNFRLRRKLRENGFSRHSYTWISYAITCSMTALFVTSIFGHSLFRIHWFMCAALTVALSHEAQKLVGENSSPSTANPI